MKNLLTSFMTHFELILTIVVLVCFIFYVIDGFTYRPTRKKLYRRFKNNTADNNDRRAYIDRLSELNFDGLSKKYKALYERIIGKLTAEEPLDGSDYYWLKRPVYRKEKLIEFFGGMFWVLFIVWFVRSFLYEPFKIPSASMEPTLQAGDFILTNKFIYGIRLPVTHQKIFEIGQVKHGDSIVFRYPRDERINYIKRVVALPGDQVVIKDGRIWIDGKEQPITEVGQKGNYKLYTEALADMTHQIQFNKNDSRRIKLSGEFEVPQGQYFVMGDNRDNSQDSRFWGFVPEENLVGKAVFIWMNSDCILARGECGRIGTSLNE